MDNYLKNTVLNSRQKLDNIVEQTARILQWLPMHFSGDCDPKFLETLIKSLILLSENMSAHELDILTVLNNPDNDNRMLVRFYDQHINTIKYIKNSLTFFTDKILRNSATCDRTQLIHNAVILDNILQQVKHVYGDCYTINYSPNKEILTPGLNGDEVDMRKMETFSKADKLYVMINRLFQLPASEIDTGIVRLIKNVNFDILGRVFCLSDLSHTNLFPKCIIFTERMSKLITTVDISDINQFLRLMILSIETHGNSLFQKCIENTEFLEILLVIFRRFISISHFNSQLNLEENQYFISNSSCDQNSFFASDVLYLLYILMQSKPNRILEEFSEIPLCELLTQLSVVFQ